MPRRPALVSATLPPPPTSSCFHTSTPASPALFRPAAAPRHAAARVLYAKKSRKKPKSRSGATNSRGFAKGAPAPTQSAPATTTEAPPQAARPPADPHATPTERLFEAVETAVLDHADSIRAQLVNQSYFVLDGFLGLDLISAMRREAEALDGEYTTSQSTRWDEERGKLVSYDKKNVKATQVSE